MSDLLGRIFRSKKKKWLGVGSIFEPYEKVLETDIADLEFRLREKLPSVLRDWLLMAGYGDINTVLSFRKDWFRVIDRGALKGHIVFAQDDLGNFYSFSPIDGAIHFICRSAPQYAYMAKDFRSFLEEFERRAFNLQEWISLLEVLPYDWDVGS
jgi:hypothetical protein